MFHYLRLSVMGACMLLSACVTLNLPTHPSQDLPIMAWPLRQHRLTQLTHWHASGALSIRHQDELVIAAFDWQQRGADYYKLRVHGSFNVYSFTVIGDHGQVTLIKGAKRVAATSPEQLLQQTIGLRLPISNLYYWIRGLPAVGAHRIHFDDYQQVSALTQRGWQLGFSDYLAMNTTGRQLISVPRLIRLNKGDLAIKIVIKHWQAN